ncbi:MAG TPA: hypothetical protein VFJ61_11195 [Solirubrobacterales bacterium]|nr:hypothetical protein [Solirubrobacterales bacterium]
MDKDPTPINARPKRRSPEALEGLSLALRDRVLWPVEDWLLGLDDRGRAAVATGAAVLALGIGIGGYSLTTSDGSRPAEVGSVAVVAERTPHPAPSTPAPKPEPEPTLHGAAPVFKAPQDEGKSRLGESEATESSSASPASGANTGNPATDTISSSPAARPAGASTSAAPTAGAGATDSVDGPPAGPAAIAVARKFAATFVEYETGADEAAVREDFGASATPELTKALMERPPRQPAGVAVPKAKVLNVVAAPSHGKIYPLSVSLLRVGVTSELRLEMEKLKDQGWRVTNVLG